MDFIPPHKYLQWNPNTLEEVRREVNMHKPGDMKEAVRVLHEWIQQQPHFMKKDFSLHLLEILILMAKGSLERAKKIIDGICTIKVLLPHLFVPYNPRVDFKPLWEKGYWTALTKLTPDNSRVVLVKLVGKCGNRQDSIIIIKHAFSMVDYHLMCDYGATMILIYDLTETDLLDTLKNFNLFELRNFFLALVDSYKIRLKRFHIITPSKIIETFINFFKPFLKDKIMQRVIVNKSTDELSTYYPKDILPKDYGGDDKSISELHEQCIDMLSTDEYMEVAKSMLDARVDESRRPQGQFSDLYAGTVGSFRSLNVD